MKKEISKNAARDRREKENVEFGELTKLLPFLSDTTQQLDKASVIRLTSSYLKMQKAFANSKIPSRSCGEVAGKRQQILTSNRAPALSNMATDLLESMNGFIFAIGSDSKITYISESTKALLGLNQHEMLGNPTEDYIHPDDQAEVEEMLKLQAADVPVSFVLRFKCVLPKRDAGHTCQGFKVSV